MKTKNFLEIFEKYRGSRGKILWISVFISTNGVSYFWTRLFCYIVLYLIYLTRESKSMLKYHRYLLNTANLYFVLYSHIIYTPSVSLNHCNVRNLWFLVLYYKISRRLRPQGQNGSSTYEDFTVIIATCPIFTSTIKIFSV